MLQIFVKLIFNYLFIYLARQFKYINEHELLRMKQEEGKYYQEI
jgi:hypothetical protein